MVVLVNEEKTLVDDDFISVDVVVRGAGSGSDPLHCGVLRRDSRGRFRSNFSLGFRLLGRGLPSPYDPLHTNKYEN